MTISPANLQCTLFTNFNPLFSKSFTYLFDFVHEHWRELVWRKILLVHCYSSLCHWCQFSVAFHIDCPSAPVANRTEKVAEFFTIKIEKCFLGYVRAKKIRGLYAHVGNFQWHRMTFSKSKLVNLGIILNWMHFMWRIVKFKKVVRFFWILRNSPWRSSN